MKRWCVINFLAQRLGYRRYLEIGVGDWQCMRRIDMPARTGVDPCPTGPVPDGVTFVCATSDSYFSLHPDDVFDIVFIDGLHHWGQVYRDVSNSLRRLAPGGTLVLHDCNPASEASQVVPRPAHQVIWSGDCWRAIVRLRRAHADLDVAVLDTDRGLGIVRPNGGAPSSWHRPHGGPDTDALSWSDLSRDRTSLLNLVARDEIAHFLAEIRR